MPDAIKYYAMFDGDEIEGTIYKLGDEIAANINPGIRMVLEARGNISTTRPTVTTFTVPLDGVNKDVADMSRADLESAMMVATRDKVAEASDEDLRDAVTRYQESKGIETAPVGNGGGSSDGAAKPLDKMTTAELKEAAEKESVTFGDDVTTNAQRAAAIQAKRDAS